MRGNGAWSGRRNGARVITEGGGGVREDSGKTGTLRKGRCDIVGLGRSLAAVAAGEDVTVGSGDGPNGLL